MGSAAVKPSVAVGRLLRQRRQQLNLTLRGVSDRLATRGERIPTSTLIRIEQGKLDPGVRRLHLLLDLYQVPPHLVSDLVELELLAAPGPEVTPTQDLATLYKKGLEYWERGDVAKGLAYLFALREYVPETEEAADLRHQASLSFAIAARNLGKYRLARQIADDLLCESPSRTVMIRVLVLSASLWLGLGSLDVALALVCRAEALLRPEQEKETAWVLHQKAKLVLKDGEPVRARTDLRYAMRVYRKLSDTWGLVRALLLEVGIHEAMGNDGLAFRSAQRAVRLSEQNDHVRGVAYACLELGRLKVKQGKEEEGIADLVRGLSRAVVARDRNAEFYAHYHLWKAHESAGQVDRATFELKAACHFVRHVDENAPEVGEIQRIVRERGET